MIAERFYPIVTGDRAFGTLRVKLSDRRGLEPEPPRDEKLAGPTLGAVKPFTRSRVIWVYAITAFSERH